MAIRQLASLFDLSANQHDLQQLLQPVVGNNRLHEEPNDDDDENNNNNSIGNRFVPLSPSRSLTTTTTTTTSHQASAVPVHNHNSHNVPPPRTNTQQQEQQQPLRVNHSHLKQTIGTMISDYQTLVAEMVDLQTASWFRYLGAYRVPDEEPPKATILSYHKSQRRGWASSKSLLRQQANWTTTTTQQPPDDDSILWDDEADIARYFDRLVSACSKVQSRNYGTQCLQFLHGLIQKPRCTVRLDSRTTCRRDSSSSSRHRSPGETNASDHGWLQHPISSILGPDHWAPDTINIGILGAGPVGLYLANALAQIPVLRRKRQEAEEEQQQEESRQQRRRRQQQEQRAWPERRRWRQRRQLSENNNDDDDDKDEDNISIPEIRIVVFENRLLAEGHKKPYSRLWGTGIGIGKGGIDPRILNVFGAFMSYPNVVSLPINIWETLLLLSCRDLGVKFIYGNVHDYQDELSHVPNLLLMDATGHRLQPLQRHGAGSRGGGSSSSNGDHHGARNSGSVSEAPTATTKVYHWTGAWDKTLHRRVVQRWQFPEKWLRSTLKIAAQSGRSNFDKHDANNEEEDKEEKQLEIALEQTEMGPLLYPVLPNHQPYIIYRFDLADLKYTPRALRTLDSIATHSVKAFQQKHGVLPPFQGAPVVDYNDDDSFKSVVWKHIMASKTFVGFEISGFSIKPTHEQGRLLEILMRRHTRPGESRIPWSRISPDEYQGASVFDTNRVMELLDLATAMSQRYDEPPDGLVVSASFYRSEPYMYKDPVVPGGFFRTHVNDDDHNKQKPYVPLLRVGNSLFSGDTDISSGLQPQLQLVRRLQCTFLNQYSRAAARQNCSRLA
ncbi:hypothetical protein ACA910_003255 [Epithemia clementina (nom. ined.)]